MDLLEKQLCKVEDYAVAVIAIIVLVAGFILLYYGIDGEVKAMMGLVIGFYFGRK